MNNRAQSVGYGNFFLALLVGAIMVWIVTAVTDPIMSTAADHGTDPVAVESTGYINEFLNTYPILLLLIAFFSLIVLSVYLRRV